MTVNFAGHLYDDAGSAVSGASVKLLETGTTTQEGSTVTTDSAGAWAFTVSDQDRYDVEITKGTSVRRIRWDDQISLKELDIRNNTGNTTPAATFTNLTNNAANQVAVFSGANSTRADGDEIYLSFKLADSAGNIDEFARITAEATDVTSGSEDGQIRFGVIVAGTLTDVFTINSTTGGAAEISYEVDSFTIKGGEGEAGVLYLFADQGDDAGDEWKVNVADGGVLTIGNDIASAGSYVTMLTITPHATTASSSVAIAGDATVGDDLSLTSDSSVFNMGAGNDFTITHDGTTGATIAGTPITVNSTGALTLDSSTDITLDADGADVFLKDGGTLFGTLTNSSGELVIKSSSSGTTAATFSGANVTLAGTVGSGAITSTGIIKTDDTTEATSTTDGSLQTDGGLSVAKDAVFGDDVKLLSDSAVIAFGADGDTTLTHTDGTGLTLNSTNKLTFGDTGTFIHQSSDGVLTITSDTTVDINGAVAFDGALTGITNITLSGTLSDSNYTFDTSGNVSGLGTVASGAITSSGIIKTDDATEATSTTDGSLQTDGGLSVVKDAVFGDDVKLLSDSAVLAFGADGDATLTHTNDTGITLNSTNKLMFNDASQFVQGSSATVLSIGATDEIDLTATAVDLNGTLDVSGTTTLGGTLTVNAGAIFNEASADVDFRVESNGNANMLFVDAGNNRVGIGTNSPGAPLHVSGAHVSGKGILALESTDHVYIDLNTADGSYNKGFLLSENGSSQWLVRVQGADDTDDFEIVDSDSDGSGTDAIRLRIAHPNGAMYIGQAADSSNSENDGGLTINQGAYDDEALSLKSSDISHGLTDAPNSDTEVNTYFSIGKFNATLGGGRIVAYAEDAATTVSMCLEGYGGTAQDTQTTSGRALVELRAFEHDGSNGLANITAGGNVFGIDARVGGALRTIFLIDEDGELYADGTANTVTAMDNEDDVALLRRFSLDTSTAGIIRGKWDEYVHYNEEDLVRTGILGASLAEGGLWNITQHARVLNGAVWQLYTNQREQEERLALLENENTELKQMLSGGRNGGSIQ